MSLHSEAARETALPRLPVGRYRLTFENTKLADRDGFLGSAWRGAFGHALKRAVCVTQLPVCAGCMLYRACTYPYVFETPPPEGSRKMRKYPAAPHPFVFVLPVCGMEKRDEQTVTLGVNLFGRANELLAHVVFALQQAGIQGVGPRRRMYRLLRVEQYGLDEWAPIYAEGGILEPRPVTVPELPAPPARARLVFETPVRIKRAGSLVSAQQMRFSDLFGSLLRRISMLTYFHTQTPLETNFRQLVEMSREVDTTAADLSWMDGTRYSSRQDTTMQMGGVVGSLELAADALAPFWPYLWPGQWTHAGRFTTMGMGRYRIEDPASLPDPR